jgi:hypothetical protein
LPTITSSLCYSSRLFYDCYFGFYTPERGLIEGTGGFALSNLSMTFDLGGFMPCICYGRDNKSSRAAYFFESASLLRLGILGWSVLRSKLCLNGSKRLDWTASSEVAYS